MENILKGGNNMLIKTIAPIVSMAVLGVSLIVPSSAFAAGSSVIQTEPISVSTTGNIQQKVEAQWRAKVTKEAIRKLADLIDSDYIDNIIAELPKGKYKKVLLESRSYIVDELRELARLGDQVEERVRDVIVQAIMSNTSASSSVANTIANIIVFLFL
ncbi:hypothetical protein [Brevibacillus sp. NL20B1]|jgi:hypothetical protein|nr:hypothetical protein [Brevibacillus sp. NL20B1]